MEDKWFSIFLMVAVISIFSCMGFLGYNESQTKQVEAKVVMQLVDKYDCPEIIGHTLKEAGEIIARIEKEKREATTQKADNGTND